MSIKKFLVVGLLATSLFGSNLNAQEATTTIDAEKNYRDDALYISYIVMPRLSANNDNDDSLNVIFDNCKNYFNDAIKHLTLDELSWVLKAINNDKKYCLELEIVDGTKENYDNVL
ncbi:hypothetical protein EBU24_01490, partial [bacterium]|nr:hypothetical protein [bacterium]